MKKKHTLWIEKYRSENLDQYIGNEVVKSRIEGCISQNDIPHFIFAGTAGTGKTTSSALRLFATEAFYKYHELLRTFKH